MVLNATTKLLFKTPLHNTVALPSLERRTAISGTTWLEQGAANTNYMDAGIRHGATSGWLARRWRHVDGAEQSAANHS